MNARNDEGALRRAQARIGLVYWGGAFLSSVMFYLIKADDAVSIADHIAYILEKLLRYASGWLITTGISYALMRSYRLASRRRPPENLLAVFIIVSFLTSLVAAPVWAGVGYAAQVIHPLPQMAAQNWNSFVNDTALGAALFFGWSCLCISLLFSFELHDRALRLAAVREEALSAQMRALRYQVNPHFLFNTINSIAGLIEEGATLRAERMALSLSTFLRTTLALDPMHDVSLADELRLQEEYLGIEQERFSDRMRYAIDAPDEVRQALVPNLILQPLIENALKHGVGRSSAPTAIHITAWREHNSLWIMIDNNVCASSQTATVQGFGIGLKNVSDRIQTRFGDQGCFDAGITENGLFKATIRLPWKVASPASSAQ